MKSYISRKLPLATRTIAPMRGVVVAAPASLATRGTTGTSGRNASVIEQVLCLGASASQRRDVALDRRHCRQRLRDNAALDPDEHEYLPIARHTSLSNEESESHDELSFARKMCVSRSIRKPSGGACGSS